MVPNPSADRTLVESERSGYAMALMESIFEGVLPVEPAGAVAFGLLALAAPMLMPGRRLELRPLLKSAAKLFVEAEFEADGAIIASLADAAVDALLEAATDRDPAETKRRIEHKVQRYTRRAQGRAARMGRDEADRQVRYRRHLRTLRDRLAFERNRRAGRKREAINHAMALLPDV